MFSPDPMRADGWMLAPGELADGTRLDVITGGPPSEAPRFANILDLRWAKLWDRLAAPDSQPYLLEYARMYCRLRNLHLQAGQQPLSDFQLHYVIRLVQPPGQDPPTLNDVLLWTHHC
jgi:hypothetical protein